MKVVVVINAENEGEAHLLAQEVNQALTWQPVTASWSTEVTEDEAESLPGLAALQAAADDIEALHPGETKNSVLWLHERMASIRERSRG